jgi:hypothetical protein
MEDFADVCVISSVPWALGMGQREIWGTGGLCDELQSSSAALIGAQGKYPKLQAIFNWVT